MKTLNRVILIRNSRLFIFASSEKNFFFVIEVEIKMRIIARQKCSDH